MYAHTHFKIKIIYIDNNIANNFFSLLKKNKIENLLFWISEINYYLLSKL